MNALATCFITGFVIFFGFGIYLICGALRGTVQCERELKKSRERDLEAGAAVQKGYSHRTHASQRERQKAQRLVQKAKDAELAAYVQSGNAAWAQQHLATFELEDATERIEDAADQLSMSDPFAAI